MRLKFLLPLAALLLLATGTALAGDHASVKASAKADASSVQLSFLVEPTSGLHINLDGPWHLELKDAAGLPLAKTSFGKADMDAKLPGFVVSTQAKPSQPAGDVNYELVAFICTNDQTQCYRDVLKGKVAWQLAGK
jgi:hypothetical protein